MVIGELWALFRRTRIRALLVVLFCIPVLLAIAVRISGGPSAGNGPAFVNRVSENGVFAALAGLTVTITFFLPLTVSIVAGDAVSGEASLGTLRYLLTRPAGRTRLLLVKGVATAAFCLAGPLAVAIGGLLAGVILFPIGDLISLSGTELSLASGVVRTFGAAGVVGLSLLGLAAIGMFISTITDVPVGAMAATAGLAVLSAILDSVSQVSAIHPWLLTHYWLSFGDLMRAPVEWHNVLADVRLEAGYVVVFGLLAWARLNSRDVLA